MDMTLKQGKGRGGQRGGMRGRIRTAVTLGDGTVLSPLPPNATPQQKKERQLALARERARRTHALRKGDVIAARAKVGLGRAVAEEGLTLHIEEIKEANEDCTLMPRKTMTAAIKYKMDEVKRLKNVIVHGKDVWGSAAERSEAIAVFLKTKEGTLMGQREVAAKFGCAQSTVAKVWAKIRG